jgi:hypothetical protein
MHLTSIKHNLTTHSTEITPQVLKYLNVSNTPHHTGFRHSTPHKY